MLKILAGVHLLHSILTNQMPPLMRNRCLASQVFSSIHAVMTQSMWL